MKEWERAREKERKREERIREERVRERDGDDQRHSRDGDRSYHGSERREISPSSDDVEYVEPSNYRVNMLRLLLMQVLISEASSSHLW